jgi:TPR repeat protein
LAALQQDGYAIEFIPEERQTVEYCITAVRQNENALTDVPDRFKTREVCDAANAEYDEEALKAAIEGLDPDNDDYSSHYFQKGEEAMGKEDFDGALEFYNKALKYIEHPSTYSQRAKAYEGKGENDKALADYTKALSLPAGIYYKPSGSYYNRALLYEKLKDYDNAIADYTQAIEAGFDTDYPSHAGVANNKIAGVLTDKGLAAYNAKDNDTAFTLWLKAAEMGNRGAQSNVGVCYDQGWGTAADKAKAVYWYQKAADQGHGQSCFNLANSYLDGTGGLPVDKEKAVYWYGKAVEAGYEKAKAKLEELKGK